MRLSVWVSICLKISVSGAFFRSKVTLSPPPDWARTPVGRDKVIAYYANTSTNLRNNDFFLIFAMNFNEAQSFLKFTQGRGGRTPLPFFIRMKRWFLSHRQALVLSRVSDCLSGYLRRVMTSVSPRIEHSASRAVSMMSSRLSSRSPSIRRTVNLLFSKRAGS